jgi:ArsR family transcriptional regulator
MPVLARDFASCCAQVTGGALSGEEAQRLARVFKALGDPARVRLAGERGGDGACRAARG